MPDSQFDYGVFINCPFDDSYRSLSEAIVFTVHDCGYYQKFISDIAGQDIAAHSGEAEDAIRAVRNWLRAATPHSVRVPGGGAIARRYATFQLELPAMCERLQLSADELTFNDYVLQVEEWLKRNLHSAG